METHTRRKLHNQRVKGTKKCIFFLLLSSPFLDRETKKVRVQRLAYEVSYKLIENSGILGKEEGCIFHEIFSLDGTVECK